MPENPGIPGLFCDIFKNAYLPYRDPETLRAFLKIIDEFTYDHSEKLGDAFEYLLSVLGSQGDAGQFRTPRHIIDFMVAIIDPKKSESVLDPACGTVGFLISAFKHILRANTDKKGHVTLTPDDKACLAANFKGYDISPDMVRLSLVNLYLHGFTEPHVYEYDTLTSEERWNETFDVILANPPFMSPKGGIKPHKRFSIQAKRNEVLFVDYIAEHLTPNGRAAIIVPEGIIFQSQGAYKELRKMLVEASLVAVISLPAGCFNPYSGVKTSILILDKALARQSDSIGFFKVENDGFGLGAQRRAVEGEQLTQVKAEIVIFLQAIRSGVFRAAGPLLSANNPVLSANGATHASPGQRPGSAIPSSHQGLKVRPSRASADGAGLQPSNHFTDPEPGAMPQAGMERVVGAEFTCGSIVAKEKIAVNGDYNLSGERYRENGTETTTFPLVKIEEVCSTSSGGTPLSRKTEYYEGGTIAWLRSGEVAQGEVYRSELFITEAGLKNSSAKIFALNTVLVAMYGATAGEVGILRFEAATNQAICGITPDERLRPDFLYLILKCNKRALIRLAGGGAQPNISQKIIREFQIPLPPLAVQQEIVAEIEGYQKVINGARAVLDHYRPHIPIHPDWPMVPISEVSTVESGYGFSLDHQGGINEEIPFLKVSDMNLLGNEKEIISWNHSVSRELLRKMKAKAYPKGTVIFPKIGAAIGTNKKRILTRESAYDNNVMGIIPDTERLNSDYLHTYLLSFDLSRWASDSQPPSMRKTTVEAHAIPLPPLAIQQAIVAEIEAEQALVSANRELITRFEQKIQTSLARVWGEAPEEEGLAQSRKGAKF